MTLTRKKLGLSQENMSNLRFIHAEEFKFILKSDYPIYQGEGKDNTFIIQSKDPLSLKNLGIDYKFEGIINHIKEIAESFHKYVVYDPEMLVT